MAQRRRIYENLAARLGILAGGIVLLLHLLGLPFALAKIRDDHLRDRVDAGWLVSLADNQDQEPLATGSGWRQVNLLNAAGAEMVAIQRNGVRELRLARPDLLPVGGMVDLETERYQQSLARSLGAMFGVRPMRLFVAGQPRPPDSDVTAVIIDASSMTHELRAFALWKLLGGLGAALVLGGTVAAAAWRLAGRPARRVAAGVAAFRADPEHAEAFSADPTLAPGGELAEIEREFADLQSELSAAFKQRSRLADLGEAVAKISHDLRNTLASAQLLADRLERSQDPVVKQIAPKMLRSLDRAADLCAQTLRYGKAAEPPPERRRLPLEPFLQEVAAIAAPQDERGPRYEIHAPPEAVAEADPDQLYRILLNLIRNAAQAIEASQIGGLIRIDARRVEGGVELDVADDGPGLLAEAKATLFKPFKSARRGGTGLGLSIAQDLARAHGGEVRLIDSEKGAHFRVWLPDKKNGAAPQSFAA